jgi:hypothetical protein
MAVVGRELEVIDSRLSGDDDFDGKQAIRLLQIGFLCIQEDAHNRPSMRAVVQMMEGEKEVPTPQEGFQFATAKRFNPNSWLVLAHSRLVKPFGVHQPRICGCASIHLEWVCLP